MNPPCGGCPNAGCGAFHDRCARYLEFVEQRKGLRKKKLYTGELNYQMAENLRRRLKNNNVRSPKIGGNRA